MVKGGLGSTVYKYGKRLTTNIPIAMVTFAGVRKGDSFAWAVAGDLLLLEKVDAREMSWSEQRGRKISTVQESKGKFTLLLPSDIVTEARLQGGESFGWAQGEGGRLKVTVDRSILHRLKALIAQAP